MSQVTKYDLEVTDCKLSQVINATELDSGRAGVDCLNVKFSAKSQAELRQSNFYPTAFLGSGLYALSFNDELIYLGSYLGSGKGDQGVSQLDFDISHFSCPLRELLTSLAFQFV